MIAMFTPRRHGVSCRRHLINRRRHRSPLWTTFEKKKLMELAAEELKAVDTIATYKGVPLCTEAGPCKSPTVEEGTIN